MRNTRSWSRAPWSVWLAAPLESQPVPLWCQRTPHHPVARGALSLPKMRSLRKGLCWAPGHLKEAISWGTRILAGSDDAEMLVLDCTPNKPSCLPSGTCQAPGFQSPPFHPTPPSWHLPPYSPASLLAPPGLVLLEGPAADEAMSTQPTAGSKVLTAPQHHGGLHTVADNPAPLGLASLGS